MLAGPGRFLMSLDLKSVMVRLPEDAYEALRMLSEAKQHDLGEEAREILTEALLGKSHGLKLLANRLTRAITNGKNR